MGGTGLLGSELLSEYTEQEMSSEQSKMMGACGRKDDARKGAGEIKNKA